MKNTGWLYLFIADFILEMLAISGHWNALGIVTKPMLVALLLVWFLSVTYKRATIRYWVVLALVFSWLGDVFLMVPETGSNYFILGLSGFLIAHILYIIFFLRIRKHENPVQRWLIPVFILVVAYSLSLLLFLLPTLGPLKIPVALYGLTISVMFLMAIHAISISKGPTAYWFMAGALLFVLSDSMLAINKFHAAFPGADIGIMVTYGLAQLALVNGARLYLSSAKQSSLLQHIL